MFIKTPQGSILSWPLAIGDHTFLEFCLSYTVSSKTYITTTSSARWRDSSVDNRANASRKLRVPVYNNNIASINSR